MQHQGHAFADSSQSHAGRQFARLRHVLELVEQVAGCARGSRDEALDEVVRVTGAYDRAPPIVQRRFDTLTAEAALWAAAGVEALDSANKPRKQPHAAAELLATELRYSIEDLAKLLRA